LSIPIILMKLFPRKLKLNTTISFANYFKNRDQIKIFCLSLTFIKKKSLE